MACKCNDTPFQKLRECWSSHHKQNMQEECCCSTTGEKPKVKGKFGIAYVMNTPKRKCKPYGWEVEFNDTLSEVEKNCKRMMNWVTCPPLGEFQNNETNICCCLENFEPSIYTKGSCLCATEDSLCRCCSKKNETCKCCRKVQKVVCCCKEPAKNQCICVGTTINKKSICGRQQDGNQNYMKSKTLPCCCKILDGRNRYKDSVNKCTECCCPISTKGKNRHYHKQGKEKVLRCCCQETKKHINCCCVDSDSQSSLDSYESQVYDNYCVCECNNYRSINTTKSKRNKRKNQKRNNEIKQDQKKDRGHSNQPKVNKDNDLTTSKNLMSIEPKKERYKASEKTPFTIASHELKKKGPDKDQNIQLKNFHQELMEKISNIKKPEDKNNDEKKDEGVKNSKSENNVPKISSKEYLKNGKDRSMNGDKDLNENIMEKKYEEPEEIGIDEFKEQKSTENVANNGNSGSVETSDEKNYERPTLKKEIEVIDPKQRVEDIPLKSEELQDEEKVETTNPKLALHGPELLKLIRRQHKREMEAIHPEKIVNTTELNVEESK